MVLQMEDMMREHSSYKRRLVQASSLYSCFCAGRAKFDFKAQFKLYFMLFLSG